MAKISRTMSQSTSSFPAHHRHPNYATQRTTIGQANRQAAQGGHISEPHGSAYLRVRLPGTPPHFWARCLITNDKCLPIRAVERVLSACILADWPGRPQAVLRVNRAPLDASYNYAHKYRTFSPRWPASMRTGQISTVGYPRPILSEHNKQISPYGYNYARKFWTLNLGLPASMHTG